MTIGSDVFKCKFALSQVSSLVIVSNPTVSQFDVERMNGGVSGSGVLWAVGEATGGSVGGATGGALGCALGWEVGDSLSVVKESNNNLRLQVQTETFATELK